ncbi:MAG TPA: CD225/dispanin family protein [Pirellulales bacterium]
MFCTKCGASVSDDAQSCPSCGAPLPNPYSPPAAASRTSLPSDKLPNYLVQAILTTLCCCLPFGIVAIVYAAQVDGKVAGGDYAGAMQSSNSAKTWCWVAFGLGLAINGGYALLMMLGAIGGAMGGGH